MPDVNRILIYRLGSLGDTVAALPCFHQLMRSFPEAERRVLTNQPVSSKAAPLEAILKPGGFIDGVIDYPVSLRSLRVLSDVAASVRAFQPDILVYLAANRGAWALHRDLLFFRLCGISRFVGAPLTRDLRLPRQDRAGILEQESRRLARTLSELGEIDVDAPGAFDLRLRIDEIAAAQDALRSLAGSPFVAVNTGGKAAEKDWGEDNWEALLSRLGPVLSGHSLVFVGGAEDSERAARLARAWPNQASKLDVCGRLAPRVSASVLQQATLFIGHDSGPLHLAAAAGAPSLGLFGHYNRPRMWWPCGPQVRIIHEVAGVEAIRVEKVLEAVSALRGERLASVAAAKSTNQSARTGRRADDLGMGYSP